MCAGLDAYESSSGESADEDEQNDISDQQLQVSFTCIEIDQLSITLIVLGQMN